MDKKLQVFVSSTYTDLIEERQSAVEAILSAGHIPAGMELFSAGSDSQLEVIQRWIDECDVYMLVLGARYGSIEPKSKKSYTQLEYEYAQKKKKPIFTIVMSDRAIDGKVGIIGKRVLELDNQDKYKSFKDMVMQKMCKICDDTKDINIAVLTALNDIDKRYKLDGWVSGKMISQANEETQKNTQLIKENKRLKKKIETLEKKVMNQEGVINQGGVISGYTYEEIIRVLKSKEVTIPEGLVDANNVIEGNVLAIFKTFHRYFAAGVIDKYGISLLELFLFHIIAPELMKYGLVYKDKVPELHCERIQTTEDGFLFLKKLNKMK